MEYDYDIEEAEVLMINSIDHEGIVSSLRTAGKTYVQKMLHSKPENWHKIISLAESENIKVVLAKFTPESYEYFANAKYKEVGALLIDAIAKKPHRIFVYETLLDTTTEEKSVDNDDEAEFISLFKVSPEKIEFTNKILTKNKISTFPYLTKSEVTISAQSFLEETDEGLLFRIYLPTARLWEDEVNRLLQLFRDYLARVAGETIRLDQNNTNQGVIYAFYSSSKERTKEFSEHFSDFSYLLNLCITDPDAAEDILTNQNIQSSEVANIITKFGKEAKRIHIDLRHSRESKMLSIRHRMESELIDELADVSLESLQAIVDATIPQVNGINGPMLPFSNISKSASQLCVNIRPQIIQKVEGIVAQEINGNITYSPEEKQIRNLIEEYGGEDQPLLETGLSELKDTSAPKPGRVVAKQRLKKFMLGLGDKATTLGIGVLQKYIENNYL
jgi:hypothetical protein